MRTTAVVIGAGHTGLATSHCLAALNIDHVVIERGEVGHSWRTERWESLRLLTPNWLTRLPGLTYDGDDPDGYMDMTGIVAFLERYARLVSPELWTRTNVESVTASADGYQVVTDRGSIACSAVVIASGGFNIARLPPFAPSLPVDVESLTPFDYTSPSGLPPGGVLVVGASASGVQIAEEVQRSGRPVTLAVGEHVRMPRQYRGRDCLLVARPHGSSRRTLGRGRGCCAGPPRAVTATRRQRPREHTRPQRADDGWRPAGGDALQVSRTGGPSFSGSLANKCALADLKQGPTSRHLRRVGDLPRARWRGRGTGTAGPHTPSRFTGSRSRLRPGGYPKRDLDHRFRGGPFVAPSSGVRSQEPPSSRRRCGGPGALPHRADIPAPPQVEFHPWGGRRRLRPDASPCGSCRRRDGLLAGRGLALGGCRLISAGDRGGAGDRDPGAGHGRHGGGE